MLIVLVVVLVLDVGSVDSVGVGSVGSVGVGSVGS